MQGDLPTIHKTHPSRIAGEQATLVRCPGLPGVELLTADFKRHTYAPHWHDAYTIALVPAGCEVVRVRGEALRIASGDVALLNPGEIHDGTASDPEVGWNFRVFYIEAEALRSLGSEFGFARAVHNAFNHVVFHDSAISSQLIELHCSLSDSQSQLERSSTLFTGLRGLLERAGMRKTAPAENVLRSSLVRAREYLDAHWAEAVTLDQLALAAGLSRFHLLREFKKQFGVPPHAYQLQMRIFRAKELLFEGSPAGHVALETGFFDQSHLTHVMKRYIGVSPGRVHRSSGVPPRNL